MILALIDHDRGKLNEISLQALTLAQKLSAELSVPLEAAVIGTEARDIAESLGRYGVSKAHLVSHAELTDYAPEAWAEALLQLGQHATAIIAPGTEQGNEVLAYVAAKSNLPMAANCTAVNPGASWELTRIRWGGSLLEEASLEAAIKLLSIAPHVIEVETAASSSFAINEVTLDFSPKAFRVRVARRELATGDKVSLTDAKVVVSGGRGVGSAEGFAKLEELAGILGGAVGCSRAVTSLGWRPHADQVGQTGARVGSELYIACGISGAIQHLIGCKGAKHILAINTDKDAPIVAKADFAVIGDLHEVLPAISTELRKHGYS